MVLKMVRHLPLVLAGAEKFEVYMLGNLGSFKIEELWVLCFLPIGSYF